MTKTAQELAADIAAKLYWLPNDHFTTASEDLNALLSLAQASQAMTDGGAAECLSELMRGLEIPSSELSTSPRALYEIGRAIAEQAKSATPPGNATQAAGAREPLTTTEIRRQFNDEDHSGIRSYFEAGVRFAERHHGIASPAAELKKD